MALYEIGSFAAGPLAARLARTRTTSAGHRAEIMKALMMISPRARREVLVAMTRATQSEPDPGLREFAARAVMILVSDRLMEQVAEGTGISPVSLLGDAGAIPI
jgi:hypothetical protein